MSSEKQKHPPQSSSQPNGGLVRVKTESPDTIPVINETDLSETTDLAQLLGDSSFSDVPSDDSNNWMQKIDISSFKQLTRSPTSGDLKQTPPFRLPPPVDHCELSNDSLILTELSPLEYSTVVGDMKSPPKKRNRVDYNSGPPEPVSSSTDVVLETRSRYPKPTFSYSCLIALALRNSTHGRLQVSEIYNFMCENFPYFRTAPPGWKNSVRHNLSLNKCFEKIEIESPAGHGRKACLWMLNPNKAVKMEQEIIKWRQKDPTGVRDSMSNPEDLDLIEKGLKGMPGDNPLVYPNSHPTTFFRGPPPMIHSLPDLVQHTHQALMQQANHNNGVARPMGFNGMSGDPRLRPLFPLQTTIAQSTTTTFHASGDHPDEKFPLPSSLPELSHVPHWLSSRFHPEPPPHAHSMTPPRLYLGSSQGSDTLNCSPGQRSISHSPGFAGRLLPSQGTPPYSPTIHSPIVKMDWTLSHSPQSSPYHQYGCPSVGSSTLSGHSNTCSPLKYTVLGGPAESGTPVTTCPTINNNSLLQAALSQSPCKPSFATSML